MYVQDCLQTAALCDHSRGKARGGVCRDSLAAVWSGVKSSKSIP